MVLSVLLLLKKQEEERETYAYNNVISCQSFNQVSSKYNTTI